MVQPAEPQQRVQALQTPPALSQENSLDLSTGDYRLRAGKRAARKGWQQAIRNWHQPVVLWIKQPLPGTKPKPAKLNMTTRPGSLLAIKSFQSLEYRNEQGSFISGRYLLIPLEPSSKRSVLFQLHSKHKPYQIRSS